MKIRKCLFKLFREYIREEYVNEEIKIFMGEIQRMKDIPISEFKIDEELEVNIEDLLVH